jgi:hypothetical protein
LGPTGALVARLKLSHQWICHPTIIAVVGELLGHASAYQLMLTQVISIYTGESAHGLHQDENAWDYFLSRRITTSSATRCGALSDYTVAMGATRIVLERHLPGVGKEFTDGRRR